MGLFIIIQVALDLAFLAIVTLIFVERAKARRQEDAKLSRGLQLLTSKTAVLQDLMDRTEVLSRQLTQLMDKKQDEVQAKLEEVHVHLHKIQTAMQKSQEVAQIFQDKIPHEEIIERQNTMKYMQAAKLANQGLDLDEIAKQVDIPKGELELIVKLNRDKLVVGEEPAWAPPAGPSVDDFVASEPAPTLTTPAAKFEAAPEKAAVEVAKEVSFPLGEPKIKPVVFKKISKLGEIGY